MGDIPPYAVLGLAVVVGGSACVLLAPPAVPRGRLLGGVLLLAVASIVGAKLYHLVGLGLTSLHAGSVRYLLYGGYRYPGALLGGVAGLLVARVTVWRGLSLASMTDTVAIAACFTIPVWRAYCWLRGCCFGTPTQGPWGFTFGEGTQAWQAHVEHGLVPTWSAASAAVHPLQLYFAALAVGVGLVLLWWRRRQRFAGELALLFLVLHDGGKAALEPLRGSVPPDAALLQQWSLAAAAAGLVLWGGMRAARWRSAGLHAREAARPPWQTRAPCDASEGAARGATPAG